MNPTNTYRLNQPSDWLTVVRLGVRVLFQTRSVPPFCRCLLLLLVLYTHSTPFGDTPDAREPDSPILRCGQSVDHGVRLEHWICLRPTRKRTNKS